MMRNEIVTAVATGIYVLVHVVFLARVILRPHREPASRVAWIVVMLVLPVGGIVAYVLLESVFRRLWNNAVAMLGPVL